MIYVLIKKIRNGCEAACLLESVICASTSKEALIVRKNKLEAKYNHIKEANVEYEKLIRKRLREITGPPYIESSRKIQEEVRNRISILYNLKIEEFIYPSEISYDIEEIETI